jgi:hypothetical protein
MNGDDFSEGGTNNEFRSKDSRDMNQSRKRSQDFKPYQRLRRVSGLQVVSRSESIPHIPVKCQSSASRNQKNHEPLQKDEKNRWANLKPSSLDSRRSHSTRDVKEATLSLPCGGRLQVHLQLDRDKLSNVKFLKNIVFRIYSEGIRQQLRRQVDDEFWHWRWDRMWAIELRTSRVL